MPVAVAGISKESSEGKESNCGEELKNARLMNNRVIKFRGKKIDNDEWIYGYFVIDPAGKSRIYYQPFPEASTNTYHIVYPESVGQFTNLLDKSGREIYDGDILKVTWQTHSTGGYMQSSDAYCDNELIVSVKWVNIGFAYILHSGKQTSLNRNARIEIIGKFYENPELLK